MRELEERVKNSDKPVAQTYLQSLSSLSKNFNLVQQSDPQIEQLARWFCRELLKMSGQSPDWLCLDDGSNLQLVQELYQADKVQAVRREMVAVYVADKIVCAELRWRKACYKLLQVSPILHSRLGLISDDFLLEQGRQQAVQNARIGWVPKFLQHFTARAWRLQFGLNQASQDSTQDIASRFEDAVIELYAWTGRAYPRAKYIEPDNFHKRPRQDLPSYLEQIVQYRHWLSNDFAKRTKIEDFDAILARAAEQRWHIELPR